MRDATRRDQRVSRQSPPDREKGTVRNFEVVYYVVCSIDQIRDMGSRLRILYIKILIVLVRIPEITFRSTGISLT